ncbi:hypothetical protein F8388_015734 [Cannabis sativa]|uniref:Uncharacterized protein n=1 Tax=Cannabis sativa TaxID=3483 RepID=A0A7J6DQQ0_CANSA|nr:hypothetical protein F8388_015734 [Cannabis sativa]
MAIPTQNTFNGGARTNSSSPGYDPRCLKTLPSTSHIVAASGPVTSVQPLPSIPETQPTFPSQPAAVVLNTMTTTEFGSCQTPLLTVLLLSTQYPNASRFSLSDTPLILNQLISDEEVSDRSYPSCSLKPKELLLVLQQWRLAANTTKGVTATTTGANHGSSKYCEY